MTKTQAVHKLQSFWRSKWSKTPKQNTQRLDPNQIQWIPKSFMIRNGQYVEPQSNWNPVVKGLAISTPAELEPYVSKGKLLTSEVNSALTCEPVVANAQIQVQQIEITVKDIHGNHALIQAWLTNFGQTPVIVAPTKNAEISVDELTTLSFTVHQIHVDPAWWKELQQHPAKFLLKEAFAGADQPKFPRIWSRRWTLGNRVAEPQLADAFSLLGSVVSKEVQSILKISGTQRPPIFISVMANRDDESKPKWGGHRVVWAGKEIEQAFLSLSSVPKHCGLVFKHPSFGIRIPEEDFQEAYKAIKNEEPPSSVKCVHRYVLANVPPSVDTVKLEQWSQTVGWPLRVLKRMSNGRYMVGVEKHPTEHQFAINSVPILHSMVKESPKDVKSILAGKLVMQSDASEVKSADFMQNPHQDPWKLGANEPNQRPTATTKTGWENYRGISQPYGPARGSMNQATIPDEIVKAQSERMTSLESDIAAIKCQMESTQQANENKFTKIQSDIQGLHTTLRTSLDAALQEQSSQLIKTFEALMKSSPRAEGGKKDAAGERSRSPPARGP
eukprot:Skav208955  [mRNA]  locus=scaffold1580:190769:192439:- [translate_table: standard]